MKPVSSASLLSAIFFASVSAQRLRHSYGTRSNASAMA